MAETVTKTIRLPGGREIQAKVRPEWGPQEIRTRLVQKGIIPEPVPIPQPLVGVPPSQQGESSAGAFGRAAFLNFLNNIADLPEAAVNAFITKPERAEAMGLPPMRADFDVKKLLPQERLRELEAASPVATEMGELAADIGTVGLGRGMLTRGVADSLTRHGTRRAPIPKLPPGARAAFRDFRRSKTIKGAQKFLGKVAETAGESAAVSALQDEDPLVGAAVGGATEAVLGPLGGAVRFFTSPKTMTGRIGSALLLGTTAVIMIPGGTRLTLPGIEEKVGELRALILAGVAPAVALRRVDPSGSMVKNFPLFTRMLETGGRQALVELVKELGGSEAAKSATNFTRQVFDQFMRDPDSLGERTKNEIADAIVEGKSLSGTIADLMKEDPELRQKLQPTRNGLLGQLGP